MSNILEKIEWASNSHRDKLMFGLDEKGAALAREHRLHGVLIDCKEEIKTLKEQLATKEKTIREAVELMTIQRDCIDHLLGKKSEFGSNETHGFGLRVDKFLKRNKVEG